MYLMAFDWESLADPYTWFMYLQVCIGLGMVIFVHELGHFAVAKWCGVKCEKFYLGFDIGGFKLFKFRYGETEYGIGILPLGGYVKMLGQEDNPSRIAAESQRVQTPPHGDLPAEPVAEGPSPRQVDPRSYVAKSVPQRMAIISAGVIMNIIFAFCVAMIAYAMGVKYTPAVIGEVAVGEAAWQQGLRSGDEIVRINGLDKPRFTQDLSRFVSLGNANDGVEIVIQRPGLEQPISMTLKPDTNKLKTRLIPTVGVTAAPAPQLGPNPVDLFSPAAASTPAFEAGDTIVAVDGEPVSTFYDLQRALVTKLDKTLKVTVRRTTKEGTKETTKDIPIDLAPARPRTLGLVMQMGRITAVQNGSPAAEAGIIPGDFIEQIDGKPVGDPMTLGQRFSGQAGQTIKLRISREGQGTAKEVVTKEVKLRKADWVEKEFPGSPASIPSMGIAYRVLSTVQDVDPLGPAGKMGIKSGDEILKAELLPSKVTPANQPESVKRQLSARRDKEAEFKPLPFGEDEPNWPFFMATLQELLPDTKVVLTLKDPKLKDRKIELQPENSSSAFAIERGLEFQPNFRTRKAASVGEDFQLAARETKEDVSQVYWLLLRMVQGNVSVRALGGPVAILNGGAGAASLGLSQLLVFLALLSANLAVLNFLPIPVLDGGHMVFLALEGIRGKPVSERVVLAFHYAGFALLLSLMLFVFALDLKIVSRTG